MLKYKRNLLETAKNDYAHWNKKLKDRKYTLVSNKKKSEDYNQIAELNKLNNEMIEHVHNLIKKTKFKHWIHKVTEFIRLAEKCIKQRFENNKANRQADIIKFGTPVEVFQRFMKPSKDPLANNP